MSSKAKPLSHISAIAEQRPSIESYKKHGGFKGLDAALKMDPAEVIETVIASGLRGRGGAGFPTGKKWARISKKEKPILVCNADEGEPGTFKDRYIMHFAPFAMLEGMAIAAYAVGAEKGYIYIRGEYPEIADSLLAAVTAARDARLLGEDILGSGFTFHVELRRGGGSYVVGDETALLSSLMGGRGFPWMKPPYPTEKGAWDKPTVVNNVETLSYLPLIFTKGAKHFSGIGPKGSPGPKLFCLSGHVARPGVYEYPMGTTVEQLIEAAGGVSGSLKAVQIGGTAGPVYPERALPYRLDYDSMKEIGGSLGSGAVVVMNAKTSMIAVLEVTMRFFAEESCGQCFPCRYGTRQLSYMAGSIASAGGSTSFIPLMRQTAEVMDAASFCPFGQSLKIPLNSILDDFGDEIERYIREQDYMRKVG
jgi:NADH:ubiquinone oxidoreductase subunit F (NADH-binding)